MNESMPSSTHRKRTRIKVCGLTSVDNALMCVEAGVDTLGINFWSGSKRYCSPGVAAEIVRAVSQKATVVGLFVNAQVDEILRVRDEVGLHMVQLHGDEPPEMLDVLLPSAFKALRVARGETASQVSMRASAYGGDWLLLDAAVPGQMGGTGHAFDWTSAAEVASARKVWLAGGLGPENVSAAIDAVDPFGVDLASGVESAPGVKDPILVKALVDAVRR